MGVLPFWVILVRVAVSFSDWNYHLYKKLTLYEKERN